MSAGRYAVPLFLAASALALLVSLLPTHVIAGKVLRLTVAARSLDVTQKRRISAVTQAACSAVGCFLGAGTGLALLGLIGPQGLALGGALALAGAALPFSVYRGGWHKGWVAEVNGQTLRCLRTVYMLSGMGGRPVAESLRTFAQTWAGRSALADLLLECSPMEDPIEFLSALEIPGQPFAVMVMALRQAAVAAQDQRRQILEQNLTMALGNLKNELRTLGKRRALTAIVVAVVILLPTLMVTVLGPPLSSLIGLANF